MTATAAAQRLADQPWLRSRRLRRLVAAFPPGSLRCVGGCVRDSLAGLPVKDVDMATPLPPEQVIAVLEDAGLTAVPTGLKHGTITAVIEHHPFEITTLRRDVATDGRHAEVAFIDDWVADAARRDLTINAIYCDPDGSLFDPFGGAADLAAGRVRFVGDPRARIEEDYLRLLRFFRFHARYGRGAPDGPALAACTALAPGMRRLSAERIHDELKKLLAGPRVAETIALMEAHGILHQVDPGLRDVARLRRLVAAEAMAEREGVGIGPDAVRRLAALLTGDPAEAADRLRLSNKEAARITAALATEPTMLSDSDTLARRQLIYALGAEAYRDRVLLAWAGDPEPDPLAWVEQLSEADRWPAPRFPLSGRDALALGVPPGPAVGRLLDQVEDWWRTGGFVGDRAACLAELRRRATPA